MQQLLRKRWRRFYAHIQGTLEQDDDPKTQGQVDWGQNKGSDSLNLCGES